MPEPAQDSVSYDVVVVNYQSTDLLLKLLSDFKGLIHPPAAVYVVDNASRDEPRRILKKHPGVNLILSKSNLGFGRAANFGWRKGKSPLVLFINPDARLLDEDYGGLFEYLARHPHVGAVGPKILDEDGGVQGSARGFHSFWTIFAGRKGPLTRMFPDSQMVRRDVPILHSDGANPMRVDWLSGACLLVRRIDLMRVGGFDERFFMYFEDTDISRELLSLGLETHYYPKSRISHRVAGSSPEKPVSTILWFHQSCYRYLRKHHLAHNLPGRILASQLIALRCCLMAGLRHLMNLRARLAG